MRSNEKVSVIIPVIRPEKAKRCIEAIEANAGIPGTDYEIVTGEDYNRIGCPEMVKYLVSKTTYDIVCFLGDDTIPQKDFLKNAVEAMRGLPDGWGLVGLNDQFHDGKRNATHWLAHKNLLPLLGGEFFSTVYKHCFCDNELTERCIDMGRYTFARNAVIMHDHPIITKNNSSDADYKWAYSPDVFLADKATYYRRKRERNGFKLGIGFPIVDERVPVSFMTSFIAMEKPNYTLLMPDNVIGELYHDIAAVRNNLVTQALNEGCTHLIMMDTDQVYPQECITKMLSHDKDIVGVRVHRRYPPFEPIFNRGELGKYKHVPDEECFSGKLISVDATGTGCIMFNTKIFLDIPYPWFQIGVHSDGKPIGEDIGFCHKLRQRGYEIWIDTSVEVDHLSTMRVNRATYELFKKMRKYEWAS